MSHRWRSEGVRGLPDGALALLVACLVLVVSVVMVLTGDGFGGGGLVWAALAALALGRLLALMVHNLRLVHDLRVRAVRDHLTGVPNRAGLDKIVTGLADGPAALLLVGLDRFKTVNELLGHRAGDALLAEAARRLRVVAGPDWVVTRLAGDEFVIVGSNPADVDLEALGVDVTRALAQPFSIDDTQAWVTATVGVAATGDGLRPANLLEAADRAMRQAKSGAGGTVLRVGADFRDEVAKRRELEEDLRRAIDDDELFCAYQPKVDITSGRLVGVEALVRWDRPGHGVVPPDLFIPVAEASGLVTGIDEWMLTAAVADLGRWNELGPRLSLSVNMSAWQLSRVDVHEHVARTIARHGGVDPAQITIEITETALIEAPDVVAVRLNRLRDLGVKLSVDDFGAGYTAIAYLVDFPVNQVKMDKTLVDPLGTGSLHDRSLAAAVVALARALELEVIAEGVETTEQLIALRRLGCDLAQGYLFSKPVPAEEIERLLLHGAVYDVATPAIA